MPNNGVVTAVGITHLHFLLCDKADAVLSPDSYAGDARLPHRLERVLCQRKDSIEGKPGFNQSAVVKKTVHVIAMQRLKSSIRHNLSMCLACEVLHCRVQERFTHAYIGQQLLQALHANNPQAHASHSTLFFGVHAGSRFLRLHHERTVTLVHLVAQEPDWTPASRKTPSPWQQLLQHILTDLEKPPLWAEDCDVPVIARAPWVEECTAWMLRAGHKANHMRACTANVQSQTAASCSGACDYALWTMRLLRLWQRVPSVQMASADRRCAAAWTMRLLP